MQGKLVGRGRTADVYEYGPGKVLKLSHGTRGNVEWEYKKTEEAARCGLPAPAVYGLMEADGHWGFVMDRLEGESYMDKLLAMIARTDTSDSASMARLSDFCAELCRILAGLLHKVHTSGAVVSDTARATALRHLRRIPEGMLEADEIAWLTARVEEAPAPVCVCHGDAHPGNVLDSASGPILIDWCNCVMAGPMYDAAIFEHMLLIAALPDGDAPMDMSRSGPQMWNSFLRDYLAVSGADTSELDAYRWVVVAQKFGEHMPEHVNRYLVRRVRDGMAAQGR